MIPKNPHAVYVNCDVAMDYDSENSGGIGFVINFPDSVLFDPIPISIGRYVGGNIERLEIEALIQAMKETISVFHEHNDLLRSIDTIIFITDRYGLREDERTSPYLIQNWRSNHWKSHEDKPIKNHKLLDELDKTRKKLAVSARSRIKIEYRRRRQNKAADKLAKAGKKGRLSSDKLSMKGEKIGRRKYEGGEISYTKLAPKDEIHIHVFKKDPVQEEWEISVEICDGNLKGSKLKIYTDDLLAKKLKRRNKYLVRIKTVFNHHIHIYRTITSIKKTNDTRADKTT